MNPTLLGAFLRALLPLSSSQIKYRVEPALGKR